MRYLNENNLNELIKEGSHLVDFYADWCGPCKMLGPALEKLTSEREDINIIKVNVDEHEDIARRFTVLSIPTLHLYKDGKLISERKGFLPSEMLREWIDDNIK